MTRPVHRSSTKSTDEKCSTENTGIGINVPSRTRPLFSKSYAQAAKKTSKKLHPQTDFSVVNNDTTETVANEELVSGSNIEQLILDLVKSAMPIIKKIISNVITSLFQNAP